MIKHTVLIWAIVLHHTQVSENQKPAEIRQYHKRHGFGDIAYHVYIEQDGKVFFGVPFDNRGTHAAGRNNGTIGVCLSGDFSKNKPTTAQLESLVQVIGEIKKLPNTEADLKLYTHSQVMKMRVRRYAPVDGYDCPGKLLQYLAEYVDSKHEVK